MNKHKTRIMIIIALCVLIIYWLVQGNTLAIRPVNLYKQSIPFIYAETDADMNGIDDHTDILQSALDYVSTRPKYKSKYYASGYPDDEFGTCVDVVGFTFKGAGNDLQNLVDQDIRVHREQYDIDVVDRNIDFRRVKNLRVFFQNHAEQLTTDPSETEQWQGGDIVVFENHIGIVSDRRDRDGVPYVIHHSGTIQLVYEEDILPKRTDITGHFRFPG